MDNITRLNKKDYLRTLQNFLAVSIPGPRQCGKSTLSGMIQKELNKDFKYHAQVLNEGTLFG